MLWNQTRTSEATRSKQYLNKLLKGKTNKKEKEEITPLNQLTCAKNQGLHAEQHQESDGKQADVL